MDAFKITPEKLIGKTVVDVFGEEIFNTVIKPNADRCLSGEKVNFQGWFEYPAYGRQYMDITYYPYLGTNKEVKGFVVNGRNITDRIQAEEELKKYRERLEEIVKQRTAELELKTKKIEESQTALTYLVEDVNHARDEIKKSNEQLEAANKELESFTYSVSHDLRAPLRAIHGFTNKFLKNYNTQVDKEGNRILNIICDNTAKMGQLIDDLLTFSRIGRTLIKQSEIDLNSLTKEISSRLINDCQERKIRFDVEELPPLWGDKAMIRQVFYNLLSNAVKFTKHKKLAIINVGCKLTENKKIYFVKDNGVGFEMKYVDKLFQVFQRLHSDNEFEGTGVGLAIVQQIIQRHGGEVWAEAKVNKGTTFYLKFPKMKENKNDRKDN
jgi:two-component system sensor kinase